jgi:hypothetical protein
MTPLSPISTDQVRRFLTPFLALAMALPAFAQVAPAPQPTTEQKTAPAPAATPSAAPKEDEQIVLSPFVVTTTKDTGYFAANTLAGSRMNTNLADLGASISIVTKEQMEDFASVDVNDVFRYEVNTEGSSTYTPSTQAFRNDGVLDVNAGGTQGNAVVALTNAGANRVRGLGVPSASTNYYPSISAVAPDAYNVQSYEISRGPNSMLFGLGSPAGIVNQTTSQATLNRDTNRVVVRTDDRGSFRSSLAVNRSLIKDKLAIYGAVLYDDRRFERKPSYDITRRQYAAITVKPFAKTTIRANFENYDNHNRRPNTISPIDYVTQWNLAGRPTYDALTKKITQLTGGKVYGPYISDTNSPYAQQVRDFIMAMPGYDPTKRNTGSTNTNFTTYNGITIFGQNALNPALSLTVPNPAASALYVPGLAEFNQARTLMQIGDGQLQNWFQPLYGTSYRPYFNIPGTGGTTNPKTLDDPKSNIWNNLASADVYNRDYFQSTGWTNNSFVTNLGGYRYPGVTDRAIYDWKSINVNQANYGYQKNRNYNVELEQQITRDLFLNAGWFRQDFKQTTNYTIAQLNATALRIDVNKYLPNGQANPYFGLPYVNDFDPDRYVNNERDDHFRAMLAYTPDFTQKNGWLKWLGHHQFIGVWSRDEYMSLANRQRLRYIAAGSGGDAAVRYLPNPNNNADGSRSGWSYNTTSIQRNYYLANPGDPMGAVTRSSGEWNASTYNGNIQVYNYATNKFEDANVTTDYVTFDSPGRTQKTLQSLSAGMTNYLWKDRLVTTFGARLDKFKARGTTTGAVTLPDGTVIPALTAQQKFTPDGYFDMNSVLNRFNNWSRTTGRTKTGGGVLRPFRGWSSIEDRAAGGNQFWQIVRDFGLSYNWSDNFDAPSGAQNDAFGRQLPNPQGVGRDFGFQFSALDNKLFARVSWFKANNQNQRISSGTAIGRLTAMPAATAPDGTAASVDALFRSWARTIAKINMGLDPTLQNAPALTAQQELDVEAGAEKIWKMPYNYYADLPGAITATGDSVAKGMEVQLNYNTGNWRNRLTFGKQETVNSNVLKQYDEWFAYRNPVWQAAKAKDYLLPQYQNLTTYTVGTGGTAVDLTNFWTSYGFNSSVRLTDINGNTSVANYFNINVTPQVSLSKDLDGQAAPGQRKYRWAYNTGYDFSTGRLKGFGAGGAIRWEAKSVIGYYGRSSGGNAANPKLIDVSDTTRPIYDQANVYVDMFLKYKRKILSDHVTMTVQLNVENVFEDGHLQVVAVNYDGSPYGYRIIDSRKFSLTTTFDF